MLDKINPSMRVPGAPSGKNRPQGKHTPAAGSVQHHAGINRLVDALFLLTGAQNKRVKPGTFVVQSVVSSESCAPWQPPFVI